MVSSSGAVDHGLNGYIGRPYSLQSSRKGFMPASDRTVFVVDDESVIAQTLAMILNSSGFKATAFDHPEKALAAAQESSPELLITDVVMPGMSLTHSCSCDAGPI
jgi:PleD family two-component response regulator